MSDTIFLPTLNAVTAVVIFPLLIITGDAHLFTTQRDKCKLKSFVVFFKLAHGGARVLMDGHP